MNARQRKRTITHFICNKCSMCYLRRNKHRFRQYIYDIHKIYLYIIAEIRCKIRHFCTCVFVGWNHISFWLHFGSIMNFHWSIPIMYACIVPVLRIYTCYRFYSLTNIAMRKTERKKRLLDCFFVIGIHSHIFRSNYSSFFV